MAVMTKYSQPNFANGSHSAILNIVSIAVHQQQTSVMSCLCQSNVCLQLWSLGFQDNIVCNVDQVLKECVGQFKSKCRVPLSPKSYENFSQQSKLFCV